MDNLIIIGTIVKPQGIKGEVKVVPYTDDVMRFTKLEYVYIDTVKYTIENLRINGRDVFIKLLDVNDRNTSETLRGKQVLIPKDLSAKPSAGRYLITDLYDCKIICEGNILGILVEILQYGAADVYVVKTDNNKTLMFPALKDLIMNVDIKNKIIEVAKKRLDEVAVYED